MHRNDRNEQSCWWCVWRTITGPGNDPTLGCGHTSSMIRQHFGGCSTAATCKEYLEDDPSLKITVVRDTREALMEGIHQMVVENGQFDAAAAILDYFSPNTYSTPKLITCDDFCITTEVQFGGSEGIYLDCYAEGRIQPESPEKRWEIGTYKTLGTSLSAMQIFGALGGALTYYGRKYLMENIGRFLSDRELRVRCLKQRQKEKEAAQK